MEEKIRELQKVSKSYSLEKKQHNLTTNENLIQSLTNSERKLEPAHSHINVPTLNRKCVH